MKIKIYQLSNLPEKAFSSSRVSIGSYLIRLQKCRPLQSKCRVVPVLVELENVSSVELIGLENANLDENGRMLIPLGDHEHGEGIQRLDKNAAEKIVSFFNSVQKFSTRRVHIYEGHPDSPKIGHKFPNKLSQGYIKGVSLLENHDVGDGERRDYLALTPKYGKKAQELLENLSYQFFSPTFLGRPVGRENGRKLYQLEGLKSVGFTNNPNIPVVAIANEDVEENLNNQKRKKKTMFEWLKGRLHLDNDATDADVEKEIAKRFDVQEELNNEKKARADEAEKLKTLEEENAALKAELENEKAAKSEAEEKFASERKTRAEELVNTAIADRRISAAEKESWMAELENSETFEAKTEELENKKPALPGKDDAKAEKLGGRKKSTAGKIAKIQQLVKAKEKELGGDKSTLYDRAFAAVKKENAELFEG